MDYLIELEESDEDLSRFSPFHVKSGFIVNLLHVKQV